MANPVALSPRSLSPAVLLIFMSPLIPLLSLAQQPSSPQTRPPSFAFRWLDDKSTFQAGETVTITVQAMDLPPSGDAFRPSSFYFSVTVNGKKGNSTLITDVTTHIGGDPSSWNITFVPLKAGYFITLVAEERFGAGETGLQFTVTAAGVHAAASLVSWMFDDWHVAGARTYVSVVPKDAFGNAIPRGADVPANGYFSVSGYYGNGSTVEFLDFHFNGWTDDGCLSFDFGQTLAGEFMVHILGNGTELRGSPLLLTVKPGPMDISKSTCSWKHGSNFVQVFSKLEIFIYQRDTFGNIVPEIHHFDTRVVNKATNFYVPVVDLSMEAVADGVQLLSYNAVETGEYELTIFDAHLNQSVSSTAYMFKVFVGYCNGSNSFANGTGLSQSVAGSTSSFTVFLEDKYGSPSPVETAVLQVEILSKNGTASAHPIVVPIRDPNGTTEGQGPGPAGHQEACTLIPA